jgi:hypothetical protein
MVQAPSFKIITDRKTNSSLSPPSPSSSYPSPFTIFFPLEEGKKFPKLQTDRETERQRDRETERQRNRETGRQRDRETDRQRDRETERQMIFLASFLFLV